MAVEYSVVSLIESIRLNERGSFDRGFECRFRTASGATGTVFIPQSSLEKLTPEQAGEAARQLVGTEAERMEAIIHSGEKSGVGAVLGTAAGTSPKSPRVGR